MKFYLAKAILINRAPFNKLELSFNENEVAILSAINGKGKTTILSHIADAFHEFAKPYFPMSFEGRESKYYRISSSIFNLDNSKPSIVYLRFRLGEEYIDYVDIRNDCSEEQYNSYIEISDKIPFGYFNHELKEANNVKKCSENLDKSKVELIFRNNVIGYFPSYRFEEPGYLNDPYKVKLNFRSKSDYSGSLPNKIEVVSGLPELADWIMDLVLDLRDEKSENDFKSFSNLNQIITAALSGKNFGNLSFGVGKRLLRGTRIRIVKTTDRTTVYPNIFNISSGEAALLSLFGEVLRQADNNLINIELNQIKGIVLVDEVDKHLHIKLQKEVLPKLFELFPNIQFIVSSHSPFLSMGLAESNSDRSKIIDLDRDGIIAEATTNDLYDEVYKMMISENDRFKSQLETLKSEIKEIKNTIVITEGKTDAVILQKALKMLDIKDLDVTFTKIEKSDFGSSKLSNYLENIAQFEETTQKKLIIGIFDRDEPIIVDKHSANINGLINYSENVKSFCIPLVNEEVYETELISIEHYFAEEILKKCVVEKRLYLGKEFNKNRTSIDGEYILDVNSKQLDNIISGNKIIDCNVFKIADADLSTNIALSKADFATSISNDSIPTSKDDYNNFKQIFAKLKELIDQVGPHEGLRQTNVDYFEKPD